MAKTAEAQTELGSPDHLKRFYVSDALFRPFSEASLPWVVLEQEPVADLP